MKGVGLNTFLWSVPGENVKNLIKQAIVDFTLLTPNGNSPVWLSRQIICSQAALTAALIGRPSPAIGFGVQALSLIFHSNAETGEERR
jgi:hypothetical protein